VRLYLDFETRSEADISVGAWNYSRHPSTRALCVAVAIDGDDPVVYDLAQDNRPPPEWVMAVQCGAEIHAFNAGFEYSIITNVLKHWPQPHAEMWRDTQAKCLACGFPAKLETAAKALKLADLKDEKGSALIRYFCSPVSNGEHKGEFRDREDDLDRWAELLAYCKQDVVTQRAIDKALPDLSDDELAFWLATWEMNRRGTYIDLPLVRALKKLADDHKQVIFDSMEDFAAEDLTKHQKVLTYVQSQGVEINSVAKARVKEALQCDLPQAARSVLEARQAIGKTSLAKLDAFISQTGDDSRLRFQVRHHGTTTGRDTAQGVQITNLPRGEKMNAEALIAAAMAGDMPAFTAAATVKGKVDPLGGVVTCLRGCVSASPGTVLHQCDWSAVEPRIGAWLVNDRRMMDAFETIDTKGGVDIYQIEASGFYGCAPEEVKGDKRQFGKVYTLACQYGAGGKTVQTFAKDQFGVLLSGEDAESCKTHWRASHPLWVNHWRDVETAYRSAIACPKRVFAAGKSAFCFDGTHLKLRLPSGRVIWFPYAEIQVVETGEDKRECLTYEFVHGKTKQWVRGHTYGAAVVNAITQGTGSDILRYATRNLRARGTDLVLRVHDELVCEAPVDDADAFTRFKDCMLETPPWAKGLRLNGAGWTHAKYRKD